MSYIQSVLTNIQDGDYMSLAVLTAVGYDYVLTFSKEVVEYVWSKPWTLVSTLFVLVRYFGLFSFVIPMLMGTSFLSGPPKVSESIMLIYGWTYVLFLGPADYAMILRVWVIYNRSRLILTVLLVLLTLEIILLITAAIVYSVPSNVSATTVQIVNVSVCTLQTNPYILTWTYISTISQVALGGTMCLLVLIQFLRQSLQMYRASKQWQLNRYMNLFAREGIIYFLVVFLYNIVNVMYDAGKTPTGGWQMTLLFILEFVPIYTLTPRFILSIRELYAKNRVDGVDTGFGLSSSSSHTIARSEIVFADVEGGSRDVERTLMEHV